MYVISNTSRVYITLFLFLCSAFFSTASLAADGGYWSTTERRMIPQSEVNSRVQGMLDSAVKKPAGSTLGTSPSASSVPAVTKNASGGLSATSQNIINNLGHPSTFDSTLNNSVASAKNALKSCVRSPACAGRALGVGAVLYEGIKGWQSVYEYIVDDDGIITIPDGYVIVPLPDHLKDSSYRTRPPRRQSFTSGSCSVASGWQLVATKSIAGVPDGVECFSCEFNYSGRELTGYISSSPEACEYQLRSQLEVDYKPVPLAELDSSIDDSYNPEVSDAPIVLLSGEPESIALSTPASVELPSTTTTNTSSSGQTTTSVTNNTITYNVTNNNTTSPSINSSTVSDTTVYDGTGNITDTSTSTTISSGVQPAPSPAPSPSTPIDFELPSFCSWASIVCDWIGWTKEGLQGEEPDLINLISEFEPDENQYESSIGSGSCPEPISLYVHIINRTVEVSYQPFCDFLDMIRPLVIAGAWLLSAFMYVGVLRRG